MSRGAIISEEQSKELDEALGFEREVERKDGLAGMSAQSLSELDAIATQITETVDKTVLTVAKARLKIGKLLLEAREKFPGDNEFGKWRKKVLPEIAQRTATSYMAVARDFKDAPALVEAIGWTAARELISAPDSLKKKVKAKAEEGETTSAAEIKEAKAASQHGGADSKPVAPPPSQVESSVKRKESLDKRIGAILDENPMVRISAILDGEFEEIDEISQCAIIFGFGPEICDTRPNMGSWIAVYDVVKANLSDDEDQRVLDQAYSKLKEYWGGR
jgi:hypothetical protein